jgi:hypothetical protein
MAAFKLSDVGAEQILIDRDGQTFNATFDF